MDKNLLEIYKKVENGERLTFEDGVKLFQSDDLITIGMMADMVRWRLHPEPVVTYIIDRNINYPNPFNPTTTIEFSIPTRQNVTLKIYTILGQEIATLVDEVLDPGTYRVIFDASKLATGSYIYTLKAGKYVESKKLMFVK